MASSIYPLVILLVCILAKFQVDSSGDLVLEDGYTVTTILDGNKLKVNPHSVLPLFGSSDLVILDDSVSTFYTLSLAAPQGEMVKKLTGNGMAAYADGELDAAMFNKPRSFAVDYKGNLYVAERFNYTIRKISKSGVTTIAGGYSQKKGRMDGPAQYATFSDNIELVFIPGMCALLMSDRGNKLVRQINLKAEDCSHGSRSVMGQASVWALGLGLSCLLGLIIGFLLRPYVPFRGGLMLVSCNKTWTHCLTSLGKQLLMLCFDTKNAVVRSTVFAALRKFVLLSMSTLSLMFRINMVQPQTYKKPVSLLDCDHLRNNDQVKSNVNQLKDLISFDEGMVSLVGNEEHIEPKDDENENRDCPAICNRKVDSLIEANLTGFAAQANDTLLKEHVEYNLCLGRRKYKALL